MYYKIYKFRKMAIGLNDKFIITMFDYNTGKWYYLNQGSPKQDDLCNYDPVTSNAWTLQYTVAEGVDDPRFSIYLQSGSTSIYTVPQIDTSIWYYPLWDVGSNITFDSTDFWQLAIADDLPQAPTTSLRDYLATEIYFNTDYILTRQGYNFVLEDNKLENYYSVVRFQPVDFNVSQWDGTPIPSPQVRPMTATLSGFGQANPPIYNPGDYFNNPIPFSCAVNDNETNYKIIIFFVIIVVIFFAIILTIGISFILHKRKKSKKMKDITDDDNINDDINNDDINNDNINNDNIKDDNKENNKENKENEDIND